MNVELSDAARQRVEQLVADGSYPSVTAVLDAAVEQLAYSEAALTRAELDAMIDDGYRDVQAGRVHPADEVLEEARALLASKVADRNGK